MRAAFVLLILACIASVITAQTPQRKGGNHVVCYYTEWSSGRKEPYNFQPSDVDPFLCTHIIYAFAAFGKNYDFDTSQGDFLKLQPRVIDLKSKNPELKIMFSAGGQKEGSTGFAEITKDVESINKFADNVVAFLRENKFDGMDLNWQHPTVREGGKPDDRGNYVLLAKTLREKFEEEAKKSGNPRLILAISITQSQKALPGYDIESFNKYMDFISILGYDYVFSDTTKAKHHAPLLAVPNSPEEEKTNTHQKVQSIHWIKDSRSGQYIYLLTILKSGQIVFFGEEKYSALYLPDSVKSSYCLNNYVITSNFVDCYASEIKMDKNITMNFVVLPVKGVCAMTCAPSCDNLLIAATTHGSVYCFNPTLVPPENSTLFTLPDQSLLDNMFLQSQNLDSLYKQLNFEEDILKAVSAAVAANSGKNLFETTVKVISDHIFCITAGIRDSKLTFLSTLWSACVEIMDEGGQKKTSFHKIESDFSSNSNLIVNVNDSLSVNDVVSIELVYFIEKVQPLLIIPVGKIKIDACHLMCSQMTTESTVKIEETLKDILDDMESEQPKLTQSECKVIIKLPADYPVNSFFKTILASSQQRFTSDEWEKLSSGRKLNISVCISNFIVLLKLEIESRQLIIISNSTKLCHQVKEAVAIRLKSSVKKCIPENITLDLQAIHQTFEIESLNETPSEERLQSLKTNLRSSISSELII